MDIVVLLVTLVLLQFEDCSDVLWRGSPMIMRGIVGDTPAMAGINKTLDPDSGLRHLGQLPIAPPFCDVCA